MRHGKCLTANRMQIHSGKPRNHLAEYAAHVFGMLRRKGVQGQNVIFRSRAVLVKLLRGPDVDLADLNEAALGRKHSRACRKHVAVKGVENDIDALPGGDLQYLIGEVRVS